MVGMDGKSLEDSTGILINFPPKNLSGSPYHWHYTIRSEIQKYPEYSGTYLWLSMQEVTIETYDCRISSYICPQKICNLVISSRHVTETNRLNPNHETSSMGLKLPVMSWMLQGARLKSIKSSGHPPPRFRQVVVFVASTKQI